MIKCYVVLDPFNDEVIWGAGETETDAWDDARVWSEDPYIGHWATCRYVKVKDADDICDVIGDTKYEIIDE